MTVDVPDLILPTCEVSSRGVVSQFGRAFLKSNIYILY